MTNLILMAPMQGWIAPLDEVPDPVFAGRLLGDGVAIDPTAGTVHAPCAGHVVKIPDTRHAITLRGLEGAEILIHVGLETVALNGEGFVVHVRDGDAVRAGDLLISFDIDLLARTARSLLTPVIVMNGDAFTIVSRQQDREAAVGEAMMEISARGRPGPECVRDAGVAISRRVVVPLAHGIHARPAALIANEAKRFSSEITLASSGAPANARSPVALMGLGLTHGQAVTVAARGDDAEAAVASLCRLIESDLKDETTPALPVSPAPAPIAAAGCKGVLTGVRAAPGLAIGAAVRIMAPRIVVARAGVGPAQEDQSLGLALAAVKARVAARGDGGAAARRSILAAHLAILEDPDLIASARRMIANGVSAGAAWREAVEAQIDILRGVADTRIAERADDLVDLEHQVLGELTGEPGAAQTLPDNAVLLADDLLPSQLMALDPSKIAGIGVARGGPTSHVSILAAGMNVPAVVAAGPGVNAITDGATVIVDGDAGLLRVAPTAGEIEAFQHRLAAAQLRKQQARAASAADCRMADGSRIEVFANLGSAKDALAAVDAGAEGCGLLRTEFLFLDRLEAPDEDEQHQQYQAIADILDGRPLIVRTLDIGGDKPAPFIDIPPEDNPALGLRGVRVSLRRPDLLRTQLRAILRVEPRGQCRVMVPMVSGVEELSAVRSLVDDLRAELQLTAPIQVGVMIETPAAAVTADLIAYVADFLSIGSNDLAQYALAMDRGNPSVADQVDGLHPAVLRLIRAAAQGGRLHGRSVGVCGGLASDLSAAPILIGLGVTELSASPAIVPELKALIRTLRFEACEDIARRAMAQTSARAVRALELVGEPK